MFDLRGVVVRVGALEPGGARRTCGLVADGIGSRNTGLLHLSFRSRAFAVEQNYNNV